MCIYTCIYVPLDLFAAKVLLVYAMKYKFFVVPLEGEFKDPEGKQRRECSAPKLGANFCEISDVKLGGKWIKNK